MKTAHPLDTDFFPPFAGFPREGLRFLRRLAKNNNREWFAKNKNEYEELVRFPMQCLVATLAEGMRGDAPEIDFNPKKSIFRIYRDVRFSRNKAPYKTHVAAAFQIKGKKGPTESPGLYLHIEPGEVFLGGGIYMPTGPQLKAIRKGIAERPDAFLGIVKNPAFRRRFGGIEGETLKKAPLGYPGDHPMIGHLKHKQFYAGRSMEESHCLKPSFTAAVMKDFRTVLPLVRWLNEVCGDR